MYDLAKWIIVAMSVSGLIYNAVVSNTILKNDFKHLQKSVDSLWKKIDEMQKYLLERSKE